MGLILHSANTTAAPDQAIHAFDVVHSHLKSKSTLSQSLIDATLSVFGNSNFFARWAQSNPEKVASLLEHGEKHLKKISTLNDLLEILQRQIPKFKSLDRSAIAKALIDFKYQQLFRITLKDVGWGHPFTEVAGEFSDLAKAILEFALAWHLAHFEEQIGIPLSISKASRPLPYSIMAMGKLGGHELNFSSDIDIIYLYGSDKGDVLSHGSRMELSPHEYFSKLSERITQFFNQKTAEGFLYRVDLELRPEGKSGTLANSLDAMEAYYESFGADWERQAMIKAGLAAGDPKLFQQFLSMIHPFIYRKSTDFNFLGSLREMKEKIVQDVRAKFSHAFHVKLGEGGIREIEFFVQCLQLLFGSKLATLQTPNTLEALRRLHQAHLIDTEEEQKLSQAYIFLRTMEHRLQLIEEQQTHQLPTTQAELNQLARRMGYSDEDVHQATDSMLNKLETHRDYVMDIFNDLLSHRFAES
jgi:[glutamine synthetase] adenylyltransferase / [glutamine synthetase]-adenylyl-L-tyrosine phosphorylase